MHDRSSAAAGKFLAKEAESDEERIELAFRYAIGRLPSESELSLAMNFLAESGHNTEAWAALSRSLFASVDFRYLR